MDNSLTLRGISKRYGELTVLENVSLTLRPGHPLCVTGPSGRGKTTLLRIVLGLEAPDEGELAPPGLRFAAVFQEDRLLEEFDAVENIAFVAGVRDKEAIRRELTELLPAEALKKPVSQLSGGQRRRVCLVRACLAPADCLVLDEPFTGLDEAAKARAARYLREKAAHKLLLMAAHEGDIPDWCERAEL
ncbi:MAG: ABC transporter ATP-binding protein [bacterium]